VAFLISSRHGKMREFSVDTSTKPIFSWFTLVPPGECEDVRFAVPNEALLRTQVLLYVPPVTPQPFKMKAMPSVEKSETITGLAKRHGVTSHKICIIK
jgi:hypothetical protein